MKNQSHEALHLPLSGWGAGNICSKPCRNVTCREVSQRRAMNLLDLAIATLQHGQIA